MCNFFAEQSCSGLSTREVTKSVITCINVLAGFVGVHGAVTNRRLHCPLWLDDSSAGKELVDGGAEVCNLGWL